MTTLIIGGGWSGLAAAITLCHQGHSIHLIESAKQLGGRARNVTWQDKTIDNGQHLMIGAYQHMLNIMHLIGINTEQAFHRYPIDITLHDTHFSPLRLSAKGGLPWPLSLAWNLASSAGLSALLQVVKLQTNIPKLLKNDDISVSHWLLSTHQSDRLIKQLWEPLCLATLNTPIEQASAHTLATVLQDSLGKKKAAADLLIPQQPLGDLFPQVAAHYIQQHGGKISLQTRASELIIQQGNIQGIKTQAGETLSADNVIVATSPSQSANLLASHINITEPDEYPICTIYLQYSSNTRLTSPMLGLTGTLSQWIFDRSDQSPGLMAVVLSAPGQHEDMSNETLVQKVCEEVHQLVPLLPKKVQHSLVIREKRATFACTVNHAKNRPDSQTHISGLWLAGDYIANHYPATLEGAIINGQNCAKLLASHQS